MAHHQQIVGRQPPLLITRHTRSCRHALMVCAVLSFWCTENWPPAVAARALKPGGHVIAPEPGAKGATDDSSAEEACADAGADAPQPRRHIQAEQQHDRTDDGAPKLIAYFFDHCGSPVPCEPKSWRGDRGGVAHAGPDLAVLCVFKVIVLPWRPSENPNAGI